MSKTFSTKFIVKYMRMAREIGTTFNPCFSRQIGVIIVDKNHKVLGTGYNGPPANTPHCDTGDYLANFFWPQLNVDEKESIRLELGQSPNTPDEMIKESFCDKYNKCGTCPRRLVGAKSGQRSTLCSCQHAERNAITNAAEDLEGSTMFCYCGVPCIDCAGAIINARLAVVHCFGELYHPEAEFLFDRAGVQLVKHSISLLDMTHI